jgi:hypothetical protein
MFSEVEYLESRVIPSDYFIYRLSAGGLESLQCYIFT